MGHTHTPLFFFYMAFNELTLSTSGKFTSYIVALSAEAKEPSAMHVVVVYVYACVFVSSKNAAIGRFMLVRPGASTLRAEWRVLEPDLDWGRYLLSGFLLGGGYLLARQQRIRG